MELFDKHIKDAAGFSPKEKPWRFAGIWLCATLFLLFILIECFSGQGLNPLFGFETGAAIFFFAIPFFYLSYAATKYIISFMTTKKQ